MRFGLAILAVTISTVVAFAQATAANDKIFSSVKAEPITKIVASSITTKIDAIYYLNPDCSVYGDIQYRILKKPSHGELSFVKGEGFPNYSKDNVRISCNTQKAPTLDVDYRPTDGFTGEDRVEIIFIYFDGSADRFDYTIAVG